MKDISGKVAKILDEYTVAVNQGVNQGVTVGNIVALTQEIVDPDTGLPIGEYERLRLKVIAAFPEFCVAETYRLVLKRQEMFTTVNIGDRVDWLDQP